MRVVKETAQQKFGFWQLCGINKRFFSCLHIWKYQEELKVIVIKGFGILCCCCFFTVLGKSIIRESFWDSLMLGKASDDANRSSLYIWRWHHARKIKRLFHLLKQVNLAFSQSECASLEKRLLKGAQRWRCPLQVLVLSSPWVTSTENEALICFDARPKLHWCQVSS